MGTALNIISLSGKTGTGAVSIGTSSAATGTGAASGEAGATGFEDLLTALLDLLAAKTEAKGGNTTTPTLPAPMGASVASVPVADTAAPSTEAEAHPDAPVTLDTTTTRQSETVTLDLGNPDKIRALIAALLDQAGVPMPPPETGDTADADIEIAPTVGARPASEPTSDEPDPLAAVLDVLIAALQSPASDGTAPATEPSLANVSLDKKSGDTLKALNTLLAALIAQKPVETPVQTQATTASPTPSPAASLTASLTPSPTPLPSAVVDKLRTLDQLLTAQIPNGQPTDPELAELKLRVATLLGTSSANASAKAASADPVTPSVAASLGQTGTGEKTTTTSQRDVVAPVLDGAKPAILPSAARSESGTGNSTSQNQTSQPQPQPQTAQTQTAQLQTQTAQLQTQTAQPQAQTAQPQTQTAPPQTQTVQPQTQTMQNPSASRREPAETPVAPRVVADAAGAEKKIDPGPDPLNPVAIQSVDRSQPAPMRVIPSAYAQAANKIDIPKVAFEIARNAASGTSHFQIRLDPPDMGRIDVRLDLDQSGGISARLTVDRPDTLDMLQRDARLLERALAQTGLDQNKTNLEFSLRQNPFARQDFDQGQGQNQNAPAWLTEAEEGSAEPTATTSPVTLYRGSMRPGGVNLVA